MMELLWEPKRRPRPSKSGSKAVPTFGRTFDRCLINFGVHIQSGAKLGTLAQVVVSGGPRSRFWEVSGERFKQILAILDFPCSGKRELIVRKVFREPFGQGLLDIIF